MVQQFEVKLPPFKRGFHLITNYVLNVVQTLPTTGMMFVFIKHTSAALTINENADNDVRIDFENWMDRTVKENESYYVHTIEGSDDMPAHIKSSLLDSTVSIPVTKGKLNLGTWQGIYLCEFRNNGGNRNLVITIVGE